MTQPTYFTCLHHITQTDMIIERVTCGPLLLVVTDIHEIGLIDMINVLILVNEECGASFIVNRPINSVYIFHKYCNGSNDGARQ